MQLFAAHIWYDFETYEFAGVFSSRQLAREALDQYPMAKRAQTTIDEVTLNRPMWDEK